MTLKPLVLAALMLAACASQSAAPPPATPQPVQALTAEGWGPVRIGMTRAEVTAALGPGPELEECTEYEPRRAPVGLLVMIEEGRLTRVSLVTGSAIRTDRGLALGDTATAVTAAYGAEAEASPHKYAPAPAGYITTWAKGATAAEYVEDPAARGLRYEIDSAGKVVAIRAGGPSIQYVEGCG